MGGEWVGERVYGRWMNGWMDGFGHSGLYSVKTPALQQMPQMPMFSYSLEPVRN